MKKLIESEIDENIFVPIKEYESRYAINKKGEIYSIYKNIIIKYEVYKGYARVSLYDEKKYKHFFIHRLIALNFIENPNNWPQVNHKDENPLNNHASNLEWCTRSYNVNYGTAISRSREKVSIPVDQYSLFGEYINTYSSIVEAEKATGVYNPNIVKCCKGERNRAGKFRWKYAKEIKEFLKQVTQ